MSWRLYGDIGNTNAKFAARQQGEWLKTVRISWDEAMEFGTFTPGEFVVGRLLAELKRQKLAVQDCDGVFCCASNPEAEDVFTGLKDAIPAQFRVLGVDVKPKLKSRYKPPLGSDRIANATAAHQLYDGPVAVLDLGSCLTVEVVAEDGTILGGYIAAGMPALSEGVYSLAPHLEDLVVSQGADPAAKLGTNTREALETGLALQMAGAIQMLMAACLEATDDAPLTFIFTGGDADNAAAGLGDNEIVVNPMLTFEGLRIIDGYE